MRTKELQGQNIAWMAYIDFGIAQDGGIPNTMSLVHS